jgi:phenylalanyl-tRNA synthetase beta chain
MKAFLLPSCGYLCDRMTISYQWLQSYLPRPIALDELSRILTSVGLEVEGTEIIESVKGGLEGLVIGEVLTCAPHPDADKLRVTTVNIGDTVLNIVCGAPNVAAGQKVVVAPVGATVHPMNGDAFLIKKAKIRGLSSEGMICAEDEISLGESHDGIMILPEDAPIGLPAREYFKISDADHAIYIGLTPNRSDAASHIGVARDVCAYQSHHTGEKWELVLPQLPDHISTALSPIQVRIEAEDACPRYLGLSVSDVKVGPAPDWMRNRLATIGIRSINNIVDATNYVLHEYGQPLHAFDAAEIHGAKIHVRFAKPDETLVTLDGKERKLRTEDLLICDEERGLALAGVFGGLHSGVTEETQNIFIESAYFDPRTIRRSSMFHGLRTEAATHFEKSVDIRNIEPAAYRAAQLILESCPGAIIGGMIDVYPKPIEEREIDFMYEEVNKLSGKDYAPRSVRHILTLLGCTILEEKEKSLRIRIPASKQDVLQPADLVEEIMRIDGLDGIGISDRLNIALVKPRPSDRQLRERVSDTLTGMGFSEIITNSITNSKYYPEDAPLVHMRNSLSTELDVMRPSLLETGLEVVSYNLARRNMNLMLFEHGNIYSKTDQGFTQQPKLALFVTGQARTSSTHDDDLAANGYFLKSTLQSLLQKTGIRNAILSYDETSSVWKWKNKELISLQELPTQTLQRFEIKERVWYALIDWNLWIEAMEAAKIEYSEVPRFPMVQRDLALVLDKNVSYAQVQKTTDKLKLQALKSYRLFDIYEGEKLGADKKSLALSYQFQLQDRTLTDEETENLMKQLTQAYSKELGAQIRQ